MLRGLGLEGMPPFTFNESQLVSGSGLALWFDDLRLEFAEVFCLHSVRVRVWSEDEPTKGEEKLLWVLASSWVFFKQDFGVSCVLLFAMFLMRSCFAGEWSEILSKETTSYPRLELF